MKVLLRIVILLVVVVMLGVLVVFGVYVANDWESQELTEDVRASTGSSFVELSRGVTEYELAGPDSGQVVVLLAGASVPYYIWGGTFEHVANSGFRVLRYNYYGRGYSDRPRVNYDSELYEQQLLDLLRRLELEAPVDLVALSMGGMIAAAFATSHPEMVRRIVFVDPAYRSYPTPGISESVARVLFVLSGQDDAADSQFRDFYEPENYPDWATRYKVQMRFKGFRYGRISSFYHLFPLNHISNFQALGENDVSILLIWGKQDITIPFAESRVVRDVTNAVFLPVDNAAHLPHLEQASLVNPAIAEFLAGADTTAIE